MDVGGSSGFDLARFVDASCARSGVPIKLADVAVTSRVAALLSGRPSRVSEASPGGRAGSDPPAQIDSFSVEAAASRVGGCDGGVIEHGADDGVLSVEVEVRPLSA